MAFRFHNTIVFDHLYSFIVGSIIHSTTVIVHFQIFEKKLILRVRYNTRIVILIKLYYVTGTMLHNLKFYLFNILTVNF